MHTHDSECWQLLYYIELYKIDMFFLKQTDIDTFI